jgi:4-aminobutyrate aminotransferase
MSSTIVEHGALLPRIITEIPGPRSRALAAELVQYETPNGSGIAAGRIPVFWEETQGANVTDVDGNTYIDLTAGFCVSVVGHSNPRVVAAIAQQAAKMLHNQGVLNPNSLRVDLTRKLVELTPKGLDRAYITTTGSEANDLALKLARLFTGKWTVIGFWQGFHGKLTASLAVSSQSRYKEDLVPQLPLAAHLPFASCYRCPFDLEYPSCEVFCAKFVERALTMPDSGLADIAAVILEPVLGHGGWIFPPREFLQHVRKITAELGILLIADEIITGWGRTGSLFAVEDAGIVPDIMVMGKGMASGFPIAAVVTRSEIAAVLKPYYHTSTFMGHPVACAAALASIAEIEERQLVERSRKLGIWLKSELEVLKARYPRLGDVRGRGLMVGMEMIEDRATRQPNPGLAQRVADEALSRGLMITNVGGTYGNVIKMAPPLIITEQQLTEAIKIIDQSLAAVGA